MLLPNTCPCCSDHLLRHVSSRGVYWFCASCRQEMPNPDQLSHCGQDHDLATQFWRRSSAVVSSTIRELPTRQVQRLSQAC